MINDFILEWKEFSLDNNLKFKYELDYDLELVTLYFKLNGLVINHTATFIDIEYKQEQFLRLEVLEKVKKLMDRARNLNG
ncbi:MAG: hypothetical protein ACRCX2_10215 [Paraclostridium sp.]